MRYAIFGDVHANLDALNAVLDDISSADVDGYLCLGDIVGYGAEPNECIARIREIGAVTVAGNHDHAAVGKTTIEYFNSEAREAVLWTRETISDENKAYLEGLPLVRKMGDALTLVHSTLYAPDRFSYILNPFDAEMCFQRLETPVCFVGHSHVALIFHKADAIEPAFVTDMQFGESETAIVNVGSVGQPRDLDPRAAYGLYDTESRRVEIRRVEYPVDFAIRKILDVGLPQANAIRLRLGR